MAPTRPIMRRTPGLKDVDAKSRSPSLGNHSAPAFCTMVIGPSHPNRSQDRRQLLVPIAFKLRLVPLSAIDPGSLVATPVRPQELLQQAAS